jgi:hypothetical protein
LGFFDGQVHSLDLSVGPGMIGLDVAVINAMQKTDPVERVATKTCCWSPAVLGQGGELDAFIGEHGMEAIGNGRD